MMPFLSVNVTSFYKMLLGKKLLFSDLESADEELYRGLKWMLSVPPSSLSSFLSQSPSADPFLSRLCRENDITDVLDNTFSTEEERFGEMVEIPLVPGGEKIEVTEANKKDYVMCAPSPTPPSH